MVVETDLEARIASLESSLKTLEENEAKRANSLSILVFSGTFDRLMASFTIALGAAAMGVQVTMFFAFWGVGALRTRRGFSGKSPCEQAISAMLPSCASQANPSRWSFAGLGRRMFRFLLRRRNMPQLEELISLARESGVRFICCETSTAMLGIRDYELMSGVPSGGVATFLEAAYGGQVTLVM